MSKPNGAKVTAIRQEIYDIVQTCHEEGIVATNSIITDRLNMRRSFSYGQQAVVFHIDFLIDNGMLTKSGKRPYSYTPIEQRRTMEAVR